MVVLSVTAVGEAPKPAVAADKPDAANALTTGRTSRCVLLSPSASTCWINLFLTVTLY